MSYRVRLVGGKLDGQWREFEHLSAVHRIRVEGETYTRRREGEGHECVVCFVEEGMSNLQAIAHVLRCWEPTDSGWKLRTVSCAALDSSREIDIMMPGEE